ncbi:hypothetical protein [uncultured Formosa sp.]|uniref:hypothetical protein n=1 Tax=uncultured Formosa sp. TaxID=255435 RepID=UPI00262D7966|nr:hypothetical protein [uncultured Formosa sp.]
MKNIISAFLILNSLFIYGQEFKIITDTINIPDNGRLVDVAFFKNELYVMFDTKRRNTNGRFKSMKVFDLNAEFVENVFLPEYAVSMFYCDLRVNNSQLYLKQEHSFSGKTFLLENYVADFNEINNTRINIFEDENYIIYPNCNGEWGASTIFKNKKTNLAYEFASTCNYNIIGTDRGYLITIGNEIKIIENPEKLYKSDFKFDISYSEKENQGVKTLFTSDFKIYTTTEVNGNLYVLYGNETNSYFGKLKTDRIEKLIEFDKPYKFSDWFKDDKGNQILKMYSYDSIDYGLMEGYKNLGFILINGQNLRMYHRK